VLTHAKVKESALYPGDAYLDEQKREILEYKVFDKRIAYVALNSFSDAKINTLFENLLPSLEKAKGIILDLRYNGGGDDGIAFNILKHFIKDTVFLGSASTYRDFNPYLQAVGRYVQVADTAGHPDKRNAWLLYNGYPIYTKPAVWRSKIDNNIKRISAPVVILTGPYTASAAEDFIIATDNQKHITKIGQPTNGSTGMPYRFDLPGGGSARICVKKDMYPDGREFVGYGIQPDIEIIPTVNDYLKNKDVVLEAGVKFLKEQE
jgi:C-terminal processing protease CtpA/Prc